MMTRTAAGGRVRTYFLKMEEAAIAALKTKPGKKRLPHQDAAWLELREEGIGQRKTLAAVLSAHGAKTPPDFSLPVRPMTTRPSSITATGTAAIVVLVIRTPRELPRHSFLHRQTLRREL